MVFGLDVTLCTTHGNGRQVTSLMTVVIRELPMNIKRKNKLMEQRKKIKKSMRGKENERGKKKKKLPQSYFLMYIRFLFK